MQWLCTFTELPVLREELSEMQHLNKTGKYRKLLISA